MFPLLIPMAIGALAGAAANKKDRLKGAMLGAGLGAGGAAAAGGLLGAGAAGSAAGGTGGAGLLSGAAAPVSDAAFSAGAGGLTSGAGAAMPAQTGLLGTLGQYQPALNATSTGLQVAKSLMPGQAQPAPAPNMGGSNQLSELFSSLEQGRLSEMDMADKLRRERRMMGGY